MIYSVDVEFKLDHPLALPPEYQSRSAAGADVFSVQEITIHPGQVKAVDLGFSVAIPEGFELQVRPRSGLALKKQITVLNSPGTIDADYRGPVKVILMNLGSEPFDIKPGDRIAQVVLNQVPRIKVREVNNIGDTARGLGGFGSTGV